MFEFWAYHKSLWAQGKPVMAGTASILINVVQLLILRLVADPKRLSTIFFWLLLSITVASFYFAAFLAWRDEYRRAESLKCEIDAMYADVILDWLQQSCPTPAFFPAQFLADKLKYDVEKVVRGLKVLEKEFKAVRDDGPSGWSYNPVASIRLQCNLRRLVTQKP
jgi:hypothetical protein